MTGTGLSAGTRDVGFLPAIEDTQPKEVKRAPKSEVKRRDMLFRLPPVREPTPLVLSRARLKAREVLWANPDGAGSDVILEPPRRRRHKRRPHRGELAPVRHPQFGHDGNVQVLQSSIISCNPGYDVVLRRRGVPLGGSMSLSQGPPVQPSARHFYP
eukprot:TRINITY_DN80_c0_g1_i2.p1 TRINITY_DN80_c0_g1~~TRINITY_DN80_c0_g1_i2.p1  ORF type:complete len:157 (-),score=0.73 TRINITY_DN80_c0_g1_i2:59-529(-)